MEFNIEEYKAKKAELMKAYPEYHDGEPIECLNLIMKREFAEAILRGEKKVEFRSYNEHYISRLYDKDTLNFMDLHKNDEELLEYCEPLRQVKKIHFHNYNDTWHLDVECTMNELIGLNKDGIDYLHEEFGCTEMDEVYEASEKAGKKQYPLVFYFVIGEIIDTNLK